MPRNPIDDPQCGDVLEGRFPSYLDALEKFHTRSTEPVLMVEQTVRVITREEPDHVGLKVYGHGRVFWNIKTWREYMAGAKVLQMAHP